ncbi:MAG: hypothetical protein IPJ65_01785 [Archangiaceae bacterium]|nr:hypothetical protein [Archangiaceae bacterium]
MFRSLIVSSLAVALSLSACGDGLINSDVGDIDDGPDEVAGHSVGVDDTSASAASALTVCAAGPTVEGIDVSKYQGNINWAAVAASGKAFAITKLSQGSSLDPTFVQNWNGIKAAGMIRGAYQWFLPNADPIAQADLAVHVLGRLGPGDLPLMADVEASAPYPSPSVYAQRLRTWVDRVTAGTGKKPIIYTGYYYWASALGNNASFRDLPLAHAQYTLAACPRIPDAWSRWTIWQYRGGGVAGIPDGRSPGVSGAVDQDRFNGTLADLKAFAGVSSAPPPTAPGCGALASGTQLLPGQALNSCNGAATLAHQGDGNVVLYDNLRHVALWSTQTSGQGTSTFAMQGDGNLVLYGNGALWNSGTSGHSGAILWMQDDGNLVVYGAGFAPLWWTGTRVQAPAPPPPPPPPAPACGGLGVDAQLKRGEQVVSCNGRFVFAHQGDGNVVLYDRGVAIWHTHTNGRATTTLAMQSDGNLVLYNGGAAVWHTHTNGFDGASLAVQDDGNLVIYQGNLVRWASGTAR